MSVNRTFMEHILFFFLEDRFQDKYSSAKMQSVETHVTLLSLNLHYLSTSKSILLYILVLYVYKTRFFFQNSQISSSFLMIKYGADQNSRHKIKYMFNCNDPISFIHSSNSTVSFDAHWSPSFHVIPFPRGEQNDNSTFHSVRQWAGQQTSQWKTLETERDSEEKRAQLFFGKKKKKKREKTEDGQKQPWAGLRVLFSSTFLRARQSVGNLKSTIAILCTD